MRKEIITPNVDAPKQFDDAASAVAQLEKLYTEATEFLCGAFTTAMVNGAPEDAFERFTRRFASRRPALPKSILDWHLAMSHHQAHMRRQSRALTCFVTI